MNIALILSGGTGSRLGLSKPKQYIEVVGKPVISYCLEMFEHHRGIDKIQVVAENIWHEQISQWVGRKFCGFSEPGENRQLSILNGLKDILQYAEKSDKVIIHDAARPFVSLQTISDCLAVLETHEGVVPVLPVKDTVYVGEGGKILSLLNRDSIVAGQAPEGFVLGKYYAANMELIPDRILSINGSTEPAILAGMDVVYIHGDEKNFKITTIADLKRFEQMMSRDNEV